MLNLNMEDKETIRFIQYLNRSQKNGSKEDIAKHMPELNWESVYHVMKKQAMVAFPADYLSLLPHIDEKTRNAWKNDVLMTVAWNIKNQSAQKQIWERLRKAKIRMIVVKGASAAQYYPNPLYRTLGDIDLLVHPNDFDRACAAILKIGAIEKTTEEERRFGRHRVFIILSVTVELHRFIASQPGTEEAKVIDSLACECTEKDNIYADDAINGIILLDHIKKHLAGEGIGLRQIMDWHMFVEKCVDDSVWKSSFEALAQRAGIKTLAITVTGMCRQYLGLSEKITWGNSAESALVDSLLTYVMSCGNFGVFRDKMDTWSLEDIPQIWRLRSFFGYLQEQGIKNWRLIKKYPYLKCFAWLYQAGRWARKGIKGGITPSVLAQKKDREKSIKKMMKKLGIL